ncbi:MAG: hypothetical protein WCO71_00390 [Pseudomonadota bacterium]
MKFCLNGALVLVIAVVLSKSAHAAEELTYACASNEHVADGGLVVNYFYNWENHTWRAEYTQGSYFGSVTKSLSHCSRKVIFPGNVFADDKTQEVCGDNVVGDLSSVQTIIYSVGDNFGYGEVKVMIPEYLGGDARTWNSVATLACKFVN